ncbi:type II toxin-antitoxin system Phd/YefM family antitoxin [Deinococcus budaensis]|uniref:Antitoxin n=1 Tax=Deinococcus budaensis TaxID=1665626 RepID=A0A7W8GH95_9DEIO|nr:type II toxin-antitoxin system prevent-host-death family antitoxin [Deinococcus budaensis]MBB5235592.1 prevent-host-death family protein [Deinococcus budaensis]
MQTVNLYDAKNRLSQLVNAAEGGEVIIVARNGKPAAKLVPLDYGERREWSPAVQAFLGQADAYDPTAFTVDRSDLPEAQERDLF